MGVKYSYESREKKTWAEHTLSYDSTIRQASQKWMNHFINGNTLYLVYQQNSWGGLSFQHWLVTNKVWCLQFGSPGMDIYTARVSINMDKHETCTYDGRTKMSEEIRLRMGHVLGMCNYSICLRNSEHVANYVFRGSWISHQMDINNKEGNIMECFQNQLMYSDKIKVNSFPASISPEVFGENSSKIIYSFIDDNPIANRLEYYLDWKENTYNILVVGPTGAGKSHLINTFFNRKIFESEVSHSSVTKEIYFIHGVADIYSPLKKGYERRDIVVADTIGLCDTEWDEVKVIENIQGRVNTNYKYIDAVFIVFQANRLTKSIVDSIKTILKWLNYNKDSCQKFVFVATHADFLTDIEINELRIDATTRLKLFRTDGVRILDGKPVNHFVYTGFPPEEYLNELSKKRVLDSWNDILGILKNPWLSKEEISSCEVKRINLQQTNGCNIQ